MTFKSERYFTLFGFFISHGQLLLRASKNDINPMNVDVIFFDVKFTCIKTYLDGLKIQTAKSKSFAGIPFETENYLKEPGSNLFSVESANETYYIAASFIQIYENDLGFNETSLGVLQFKGRETLLVEMK